MAQNGCLVCDKDQFSTWAVAEIEDAMEALQNGVNVAYVYKGIVTFITMVLAVSLYARIKKQKIVCKNHANLPFLFFIFLQSITKLFLV